MDTTMPPEMKPQELPDQLAPFIRRLRLHSPLPDADIEALFKLPFKRQTRDRFSYLMRPGDEIGFSYILLSGFVERHRISYGGSKQILSFYVPGDPLNFESLFAMRADDALQTMTIARLARVETEPLRDLMESRPTLLNAMVRSFLVDASIFREWTVNVAQRDARARISHLLCELALRLEASGSPREDIRLPLTQGLIAEATGLTPVHVNRTVKALRSQGLIGRGDGFVLVPQWRELAEIADFSPGYLHSGGLMWDEESSA